MSNETMTDARLEDEFAQDLRHLIVCDTQFAWSGETTLKLPEIERLVARGWLAEDHENAEYDVTDEGRAIIDARLRGEAARSPSYEALQIIAQSVRGALERAGITDCDDPGEAIDVMRERYEARIAELTAQGEQQAVACTHCGSTELSWLTFNQNGSGVADGRLRAHDIKCQFILACEHCSETLKFVSADEVAQMLGNLSTAPAAGDDWREAVLDALANTGGDAPATEGPRDVLRCVIDWHVAVATDPAVSNAAPAPVAGDAAPLPSIVREVLEWYASDPSLWVAWNEEGWAAEKAAKASGHYTFVGEDRHGHNEYVPNSVRAEEALAALDEWLAQDRAAQGAADSPTRFDAPQLFAAERLPARDEDGRLSHPDLSIVVFTEDEWDVGPFFAAAGHELKSVRYDWTDDEGNDGCDMNWLTPEAPEGDGWLLVSIHDNEDGEGVVWWSRFVGRPKVTPSQPAPVVPEGWREALKAAVAAIYFTDSSDYLSALWSVVRAISPSIAELLESDSEAAFNAVHEAAPQPPAAAEPTGAVASIVAEVQREIERATAKFPTWPTDPLHACGVVQEEAGELAKAVLQGVYESHKLQPGEIRSEAVQTAAMAIRFLVSLDASQYDWRPGEQHAQGSAQASQEVRNG